MWLADKNSSALIILIIFLCIHPSSPQAFLPRFLSLIQQQKPQIYECLYLLSLIQVHCIRKIHLSKDSNVILSLLNHRTEHQRSSTLTWYKQHNINLKRPQIRLLPKKDCMTRLYNEVGVWGSTFASLNL